MAWVFQSCHFFCAWPWVHHETTSGPVSSCEGGRVKLGVSLCSLMLWFQLVLDGINDYTCHTLLNDFSLDELLLKSLLRVAQQSLRGTIVMWLADTKVILICL